MKSYFAQFISVIAIVLVVILAPALVVIYVDPFQIFHRPFLENMGLRENQRYQNAGLINSYLSDPAMGYESVAVGSSMSANITSASVETSLGWSKTLRLFVKGGGVVEMRYTLESALGTGRVKHLLWELNPWFMLDSYQESIENEDFPEYLYNKNAFDDGPYVFNLDVLMQSLALLSGDLSENGYSLENLGRHQSEEDRRYVFNTWLSDRLKSSSASFVQLEFPSEEERSAFHYPLLEQELFPLMDQLCGSDVEVVMYVPPLSKLHFAEQGVAAEPVIYMPRKILSHIESCENFRLHAFDVMPFTADMNHYRDFMHYVSPVSDALLKLMARREYVLTLENVAAYEEQLVGQLNTHRIATTYPAPLTELIPH